MAPQACNSLRRFYRVGKKLSVKADLAIYSHIVDASGQCMSVSLMLGFKLDFSSYAIWDGFVNPVTYKVVTHMCIYSMMHLAEVNK